MSTLRIVDAFARTDLGLMRDHNEDASVTSISHSVFVVADGIGGQPCGEVAATIAATTASDVLKSWPSVTRGPRDDLAIISAFQAADMAVRARGNEDAACFGMGTTLVAVAIDEGVAWVGHIGDSRVYLLRESRLHRLTSDHGFGNVLLRAVGLNEPAAPDVFAIDLMANDVFLLCTDGLSKSVRSNAIERVLEDEALVSCERATDMLTALALSAGGDDNITMVVFRVA